MGLLLKALIGAGVVVLIGILSKTRNYYIAGLIPLFPTFALIAHYIVGSERSIQALRITIIFGLWAIIPYFIYLISLYFFYCSLTFTHSSIGRRFMLGSCCLDTHIRMGPVAQLMAGYAMKPGPISELATK